MHAPQTFRHCQGAPGISDDGNDRCISGGSSGGIAAFTAAWERPEAFSRVYAASGSFVAFRGGHEYPTLVRKFEPKPIRAYLTTGTHDMENCAGDWFLLDQEMDKALKFSGYDYFFRIIDGGHVAGYMDYYQEAMAFAVTQFSPCRTVASTSPAPATNRMTRVRCGMSKTGKRRWWTRGLKSPPASHFAQTSGCYPSPMAARSGLTATRSIPTGH